MTEITPKKILDTLFEIWLYFGIVAIWYILEIYWMAIIGAGLFTILIFTMVRDYFKTDV